MALIACPECSKGISDKAPACPHCGYPAPGQQTPQGNAVPEAAARVTQPVEAAEAAVATAAPHKEKPKTSWSTWLVVLVLIVGGFWYLNSPGYKKQFKPEMPVAVKYRPALTGPGLVLMLENNSDRHLAILATLKNPSLNNTRNFRFDIAPRGRSEAGYAKAGRWQRATKSRSRTTTTGTGPAAFPNHWKSRASILLRA
jgi:hypothetical protein